MLWGKQTFSEVPKEQASKTNSSWAHINFWK